MQQVLLKNVNFKIVKKIEQEISTENLDKTLVKVSCTSRCD